MNALFLGLISRERGREGGREREKGDGRGGAARIAEYAVTLKLIGY